LSSYYQSSRAKDGRKLGENGILGVGKQPYQKPGL
jgi:hypothetical protein